MSHDTSLADDELQQWLYEADAAGRPSAPVMHAEALIAAARRRRRRGHQVRIAAAGAGIVMAVILLRPVTPRPNSATAPETLAIRAAPKSEFVKTPQPLSTSANAEQLLAELAGLERQAAQRMQLVEGLRRANRLAELEAELARERASLPPALAVQEESRSAAISLKYAAIIEQESSDLARREYERVAQRFPGTSWAAAAAASLNRLSSADSRPTL